MTIKQQNIKAKCASLRRVSQWGAKHSPANGYKKIKESPTCTHGTITFKSKLVKGKRQNKFAPMDVESQREV